MKNEAAQAGEREIERFEVVGTCGGNCHKVERSSDGEFVWFDDHEAAIGRLVIEIEKKLCKKLGRQWSASGISIESLIAALPAVQPATTEAGDGVALPYLNERLQDHTCKRVENAGNTPGLTLYMTKLGAHPEFQLYETEAFALWTNLGKALGRVATPVAAVAQPLSWSEGGDSACKYDHIQAPTPFGRILITWKGWKSAPSFYADEMPGHEFGMPLRGATLEDVKKEAEKAYCDLLFAALAASPSSERQDVGGDRG